MNGQPEPRERFFALEKLSGARSTLLKGSTDLLALRAKVEKYRETNPQRAQDVYLDLQKTRDRILEALGCRKRRIR